MSMSDLFKKLDAALLIVDTKKQALASANTALSAAQNVVDAAQTDYRAAVGSAQEARRALDAALETVLPDDSGRVRLSK